MEKLNLRQGGAPRNSVVPDVIEADILQNRLHFDLEEGDEIYEGYGRRASAYPYRQQDRYDRDLHEEAVDALVLENDLARAEFLPGFGGRLWRLWDKVHGRDLLYTNDCLRASNLALRNAWFSGGVEWNCGIIGHCPFTMDRIFAAELEAEDTRILRMYAYERVRGVTYQMDFWLDPQAPALNCHMCIHNPGADTVPMYWWSNIASPLYEGGRILVPAHRAYTNRDNRVFAVSIPHPEPGVDASRYETIPDSRDYFFDLDRDAARWIANVDRKGVGLLHTSTPRLQSRKLFVWGQTPGSHHWQRFLTEDAGEYIEIQAGLGKTQYGCIPMAPHTAWEWSERYEALEPGGEQGADFEEAVSILDERIRRENALEAVEAFGHRILKRPGTVVFSGTGDGALENAVRKAQGLPPLRPHLDFGEEMPKLWKEFLDTGVLADPGDLPDWDPYGSFWLEKLQKTRGKNWYGWYCLSLLWKEAGRPDLGRRALNRSLALKPTAAGCYLMAVYEFESGRKQRAEPLLRQALALVPGNEDLLRAAVELLARCERWQAIREVTEEAPLLCRYFRARALCETGEPGAAEALLENFIPQDIREGNRGFGALWRQLRGPGTPLPPELDFEAN